MGKMFYVYILLCFDGSLYTGYTTDIDHRVLQHNLKKGAKYTRGRTPVTLVYCETLASKSDALKREITVKKLSREKKLGLVKSWLTDPIYQQLFGNSVTYTLS